VIAGRKAPHASARGRTAASSRAATVVSALGCIIGGILLIRPGPIARAVGGNGSPPPPWAVRLLGGRLLGQGAAALYWPSPAMARADATIDAMHGASMLALATVSTRYRRAALTSAASAAASALASVRVARHTRGGDLDPPAIRSAQHVGIASRAQTRAGCP
jgi:hypothetical protein